MKILILTQYFWPEHFHINEVAKNLMEHGINVDVLTGKPNYPDGIVFDGYKAKGAAKEKYINADLYRIPLRPRKKGSVNLVLNYLSFIFSCMIWSPWLLRGKKYDCIFVYAPSPILQTIPAIFVGWYKKVPVVLWVQDLWPESLQATGFVKNKFLLGLVGIIVKYIYKHVNLILVQSTAFIPNIKELVPNKQIKYHPNSVDNSFLEKPKTILQDVKFPEDGFIVMFAGNIGSAQSVEIIIDAATVLRDSKDISFVIVGDGSRREWMCDEAKTRSLNNVFLPGKFPIESMPGLMQKASVLLVSLTDKPIFSLTIPNKVQAYMASGKPIIASLNGEGARVVVESGAGRAVPAENGKALAEAVLELYEMDPIERELLGENGKKYFRENFDNDKLTKQLIDYFNSVSVLKKRVS